MNNRITNSMLVSNFMNDLYNNMNKLSKLQSQMASGKKFAHISDDPIAVIFSQQARYKLARLEHYQSNVEAAESRLTQVETGTIELNNMLISAYESVIDARTGVKSDSDRVNIAMYMGQLRDHILQTLNTTYGDKFIYSGYNTTGYTDTGKTVAPFTVNDDGNLCYNGVDLTKTDAQTLAVIDRLRQDVLTFDLGIGTEMPVSVNGIDLVFYAREPVMDQVFEADGVTPVLDADGNPVFARRMQQAADIYGVPLFEADGVTPIMEPVFANLNIYNLVSRLYDALNGDPVSDVAGTVTAYYGADGQKLVADMDIYEYLEIGIGELQKAQNHVLAITADIGGRTKRIEILKSRYEQDNINYLQMLSDAEDMEIAEVIMNYKMAESVYRAALASGASIIQPTLMDFLR